MVKEGNPYQRKKANEMVRKSDGGSADIYSILQTVLKICLIETSGCFCFFFRWYAKRFLHPDVVSAYEYIFIWDEDLGVEHFNAER